MIPSMRARNTPGRFNRQLLPPARTFYEHEFRELRRPCRDWASPTSGCPFHPSKSKTSFHVNLASGAFKCFGCDAKGGDVIAFMRLRYGLTFREACERLGCWEDGGRARVHRGPRQAFRYLVMVYTIDGQQFRSEVLDEPRNEHQLYHRLWGDAIDRLSEIDCADEHDALWGVAALSWQLMMEEDRDPEFTDDVLRRQQQPAENVDVQ